MDIEGFKIAFVTLSVIALALGIFVFISTKNVGYGLGTIIYILLSSALVFGILGGVFWLVYAYHHYISEQTQRLIGLHVLMVGGGMVIGMSLISRRRSKKAGKLVINGQTKNAYLAQGVVILLYVYVILAQLNDTTSILINTVRQPYFGGNIFWWIVIMCSVLYWYYSTEWRGAGFVYRGKVIPFTDVEHAQWESQWTKKLKIKLKNNEQELAFIVPEEMVPAIDKYLRAFFPNP